MPGTTISIEFSETGKVIPAAGLRWDLFLASLAELDKDAATVIEGGKPDGVRPKTSNCPYCLSQTGPKEIPYPDI